MTSLWTLDDFKANTDKVDRASPQWLQLRQKVKNIKRRNKATGEVRRVLYSLASDVELGAVCGCPNKAGDLQADVWWLGKNYSESWASTAEPAGGHETAVADQKLVLEGGPAFLAPGGTLQPAPHHGDDAIHRNNERCASEEVGVDGHETATSGKKEVLEGGAASLAPGEILQPASSNGDDAEDDGGSLFRDEHVVEEGVEDAAAAPHNSGIEAEDDGGLPVVEEHVVEGMEGAAAAPHNNGGVEEEDDGAPPVGDEHVVEWVEGAAAAPYNNGVDAEYDVGRPVSDEHQAAIPGLLTTAAEKAEDKTKAEQADLGGAPMWSSVQDWTPDQRAKLQGVIDNAQSAVDGTRMQPGAPLLIKTAQGSRSRRKRKIAWGVVAEGNSIDPQKLRVHCGAAEALEVPRFMAQPVQIEEHVLQALFKAGTDTETEGGVRGLLRCNATDADLVARTVSKVEESEVSTKWTQAQISSLRNACNVAKEIADAEKSAKKSATSERDRDHDDCLDLTTVMKSVPGKTPSQVAEFYFRYMHKTDALVGSVPQDALVGSNPQMQMRSMQNAARAAVSETAAPKTTRGRKQRAAKSVRPVDVKAEAKGVRTALKKTAEPKASPMQKQRAEKSVPAFSWINTIPLAELAAVAKAEPKTESKAKLQAEAKKGVQPGAQQQHSAGRGLRSRGPPSPVVAGIPVGNLADFLKPGIKGESSEGKALERAVA